MMDDNDLMTAVREPFAGILMTTPVESVVTRGRAVRRGRRRLRGLAAAAAAVTAGVVSVLIAVIPGGRTGAPVTLTAWTVVTEPNGTVAVSIHDLRDPLGLQHALRAHGVAAIVRFHPAGSLMPGCVIPGGSRLAQTYQRVFVQQPAGRPGGALLYIDPAAVPRAAEIGIDAARGSGFGIELLTRHGQCLPPSSPSSVRISPS
jgi:hypothetical protein